MTRTPSQIQSELDRTSAAEAHADRKVGRWLTERSSLRASLSRLEAELKRAQRPSEPPHTTAGLSTVVTFSKVYQQGYKTYQFAAVVGDGLWWLSGARSPQGLRWDSLLDFVERDNVGSTLVTVRR
jgi:hypothetical protein